MRRSTDGPRLRAGRRRPRLTATISLGGVLACSPLSAAVPEPSGGAEHDPHPAERGRLHVGPLERTFLYYAPPGLPAHPAAVLVFHGAGGDGARIRGFIGPELERLARERGFVVVYPDGHGGHWNDCRRGVPYPARRRNIDDTGFVRGLIRWLGDHYGVDGERVRAIGFSNGAHLAFRLALELPGEIQAIAAFGAGLPVPEEIDCESTGVPVPVMLVNGTADPINPFQGGQAVGPDGGQLGQVLSSHATAEHFARLAGYRADAAVEESMLPLVGTGVERRAWRRRGAPEVVHYTVRGGGHTIPDPAAAFPGFVGPVERRFRAVEEAVRFFERQPSPHRTVALELSDGTPLPLPRLDGEIRLDGFSDEAAWQLSGDLARLTLDDFVQYSSAEAGAGMNPRLRYNPAEDHDLYLVVDKGWKTDREPSAAILPRRDHRTLLLKYSRTFMLEAPR
jgi:polyhydroxybutyrate depolymerase